MRISAKMTGHFADLPSLYADAQAFYEDTSQDARALFAPMWLVLSPFLEAINELSDSISLALGRVDSGWVTMLTPIGLLR